MMKYPAEVTVCCCCQTLSDRLCETGDSVKWDSPENDWSAAPQACFIVGVCRVQVCVCFQSNY